MLHRLAAIFQRKTEGRAAGAPKHVVAPAAPAPAEAASRHVAEGLQMLEAGQPDQAAAAFEAAIALQPELVPAHYGLGLARRDQGRHREAAEEFGTVVRLDPEVPESHRDLCQAHFQSGDIAAALAAAEHGISLHPSAPDLPYFLGNLELARGRFAAAIDAYDRALAMAPHYPEVLHNRGTALRQAGRSAEAAASHAAAVTARPDYVAALRACAELAHELGRPAEALAHQDRLIALGQGDAMLFARRGETLRELGRAPEALAAFEHAAAAGLDTPELHNSRGLLLFDLKRPAEAVAAYDLALARRPAFPAALNNRGLVHQAERRFGQALADYDAAISMEPGLADLHANRGNVLRQLVRHEEALEAYARARELRPGFDGIRLNEALSRLVLGRLPEGFEGYEWRWQAAEAAPRRREQASALWLGDAPLAGRTILLHAEQGLGDTIQFCRYAKLVAAEGATVLLEVQPPLRSLLAEVEGVHQVFAQGDELPAFDLHCPLLSLPLAFRTTVANIPAGKTYVRLGHEHDRPREAAWRARLGERRRPRIGLVWSGNPHHRDDAARSIALSRLDRLLQVDADFVSLQNEVRAADRPALQDFAGKLRDVSSDLRDFSETAALVAQLDLLISVDTSVAHLAAAMGKPVWLLLPANPDWRWLLEREDSPWYETMRLFRQPRLDDWDSVLLRVERELRALVDA